MTVLESFYPFNLNLNFNLNNGIEIVNFNYNILEMNSVKLLFHIKLYLDLFKRFFFFELL